MGARRHAATASSIPMLGASQAARGRHPFRQATTPANRNREVKTEAARHGAPASVPGSAEVPSDGATKKPEVQRQAQRQSHARRSEKGPKRSGKRSSSSTQRREATADGAPHQSELAASKSLKEAAAVSRAKQSTQQNGARRQHDHTRRTKAFRKTKSCMGNKTKARVPNIATQRGHVP